MTLPFFAGPDWTLYIVPRVHTDPIAGWTLFRLRSPTVTLRHIYATPLRILHLPVGYMRLRYRQLRLRFTRLIPRTVTVVIVRTDWILPAHQDVAHTTYTPFAFKRGLLYLLVDTFYLLHGCTPTHGLFITHTRTVTPHATFIHFTTPLRVAAVPVAVVGHLQLWCGSDSPLGSQDARPHLVGYITVPHQPVYTARLHTHTLFTLLRYTVRCGSTRCQLPRLCGARIAFTRTPPCALRSRLYPLWTRYPTAHSHCGLHGCALQYIYTLQDVYCPVPG